MEEERGQEWAREDVFGDQRFDCRVHTLYEDSGLSNSSHWSTQSNAVGAQVQESTSPLGQGPEEGPGPESHILHSQVDEGSVTSRYLQSPSEEGTDPSPVNFPIARHRSMPVGVFGMVEVSEVIFIYVGEFGGGWVVG